LFWHRLSREVQRCTDLECQYLDDIDDSYHDHDSHHDYDHDNDSHHDYDDNDECPPSDAAYHREPVRG
jgi:hypothetical protein